MHTCSLRMSSRIKGTNITITTILQRTLYGLSETSLTAPIQKYYIPTNIRVTQSEKSFCDAYEAGKILAFIIGLSYHKYSQLSIKADGVFYCCCQFCQDIACLFTLVVLICSQHCLLCFQYRYLQVFTLKISIRTNSPMAKFKFTKFSLI